MKSKVVKTECGWEPAFLDLYGVWSIEPGFAKPTKKEALAALRADEENARKIDADNRAYAAGLDYACGYRD